MSNNIFEGKKLYPGPWRRGYSRPFYDCEIQMVKSCEVVVGKYSLLLECSLRNGGRLTFSITKDSDAYVGLKPDFSKVILVEFERGDERCIKVCIKL